MKKFNTPVVMIIYKRIESARTLFSLLKKIAPPKMFIVSDGPKNENERGQVNSIRKMVDEEITWKCHVKKIYSDTNLGLQNRIETGLDEVFSLTEKAIILEDDCLPSMSFFYYAESLLEKYKHDKDILSITGDNFLMGEMKIKESYYFSQYFHSWGWATWQRAWKKYDGEMSEWPTQKNSGWIKSIFKEKIDQEYWTNIFDMVYEGKLSSWAYRWTYTHFSQKKLSIVPSKNLVKNNGFGRNATNTLFGKNKLSLKAGTISLPLTHPKKTLHKSADAITAKNIYSTLKNRIVIKIRKLIAQI